MICPEETTKIEYVTKIQSNFHKILCAINLSFQLSLSNEKAKKKKKINSSPNKFQNHYHLQHFCKLTGIPKNFLCGHPEKKRNNSMEMVSKAEERDSSPSCHKQVTKVVSPNLEGQINGQET